MEIPDFLKIDDENSFCVFNNLHVETQHIFDILSLTTKTESAIISLK